MKIKLLLCIFSMACLNIKAQTPVPAGNVSGTWTISGSPYLINGDIQIPNDSTLAVDPGVTVKFQGTYNLLVMGRLLAIGSLTDSISFTTDDTIHRWESIRFENTPSTNDTSKLEYCKINYSSAYTGGGAAANGGGICITSFSKLIISNCLITHNKVNGDGAGIYCYYSDPVIINNTIKYNKSNFGGSGIYCYYSSPLIRNNTIASNFAYNNGAGLWFSHSYSHVVQNVITGNKATTVTLPGGFGRGGGIASFDSYIVVDSNFISGNIATHSAGGGGIYFEGGQITIKYNTISGNTAPYGDGGGITGFSGTSNTISYNTISNNTAGITPAAANRDGGGIALLSSLSLVYNNLISGNHANAHGGGIACSQSGSPNDNPTIYNNTIVNNSSNSHGGGIYCLHNEPTLRDNIISNNTGLAGGGISMDECSPPISNNVICNNTAGQGGGIYMNSINNLTNPVIENNTIANDSADNGGGIACYGSNPVLRNTIIYGNVCPGTGSQVLINDSDSHPDFYFCDIQGDSAGFGYASTIPPLHYSGIFQNNMNSDPQFTLSSAGAGASYDGLSADWTLQGSSPCINSGDPVGTYPAVDIAGNPRISGGVIDMGAYEQLGTGVSVHDETEISIYPNPFHSATAIYFNGKTINKSIKIIDARGKIIRSFESKDDHFTINREELKDGIYFLEIIDADGHLMTKKIIVQ